jgi:hypothetical protein
MLEFLLRCEAGTLCRGLPARMPTWLFFRWLLCCEEYSQWEILCWGPSASEGPQKQDLTVFLEYNV